MPSISKAIRDSGQLLPMPVVQGSLDYYFGMQRFREEVLFCSLAFTELRGCFGWINEQLKKICRAKAENVTNTPNWVQCSI